MTSSETPLGRSYDRVHYPRLAYHYSHPDRLAVLARLFGFAPAAVERSRILELGCASGANLIPLAEALRHAQLLGIDLSGGQIAEAQSLIADAALGNVQCAQQDMLDFDPASGPFDYIIAHGVYSWTPPAAQEKLLEICGRHLAPHGVAYISFNAYPGCHLRRMVREMARYHVRRLDDPVEVVARVRALLPQLLAATPMRDEAYGAVLREYLGVIEQMSDAGIMHELLEVYNEPALFVDFVAAAGRHGLRYLTDATFADRRGIPLDRDAMLAMRRRYGEIGCEQYLDFLTGQAFRRTLLCRAEAPVASEVNPAACTDLLVTSSARPVAPQIDPTSQAIDKFQTRYGTTASTGQPLMKAAFACLSEAFPRSVAFRELLAGAAALLGREPTESDAQTLAGELLGRFMLELEVVGLHAWQPELAARPSQRPRASRVARAQAERGWSIVGLDHMMAGVTDPAALAVLRLLDGTRDREQLLAALHGQASLASHSAAGDPAMREPAAGDPAISPRLPATVSPERLEEILNDLAGSSLLVE